MERTDQLPAQHSPGTREPHPTAPLGPATAQLLAKLEHAFPVVQAVTQHETAAVHAAQLAHQAAAGSLSDLDADSLAHAEDLMAGAKAVLATAGRLDLIGAGA